MFTSKNKWLSLIMMTLNGHNLCRLCSEVTVVGWVRFTCFRPTEYWRPLFPYDSQSESKDHPGSGSHRREDMVLFCDASNQHVGMQPTQLKQSFVNDQLQLFFHIAYRAVVCHAASWAQHHILDLVYMFVKGLWAPLDLEAERIGAYLCHITFFVNFDEAVSHRYTV